MRQTDPTARRKNMPPARGTKTLGWFMEDLFDKQNQSTAGRRNSSSDESRQSSDAAPPHQLNHHHHRQHNTYNNQQYHQHQDKKQKRYRKTLSTQGAARKDGFGASQTMSESSEDGSIVIPPPVTLTTTSGGNGQGEEYWFYDVATDGYYYEQNGAKGWRRRQPNAAVHKGNKDQEVAHMNVNGSRKYDQLLAAQAAAAQAAFLQQAFQIQQAQQAAQAAAGPGSPPLAQPTMRYYDPTSDGFFYEMASVDGWKRRQPNKPVSASVPAGITRPYAQRQDNQMMQAAAAALLRGPAAQMAPPTVSSYGAALARGQLPRNTVQQDMVTPAPESIRDSASSSSSCGGDTFAELFGSNDPVFNPVQRPSSLNLEQKAVSPQLENNSNAALFDAVLADFGTIKPAAPAPAATATPSSQSPMKESWNSFRSCTLFSPIKPSRRVLAPAPVSNQVITPLVDETTDDDRMVMLLRDLDKLWATTPVSALNQA